MQIVSVVKDSFIESAPFNWGVSLFSFGCNLQCSFCKGYNYETIMDKNNIIGDVFSILEEYVKPCHDCVIFIGGEPTIWGDTLIEALKWCKDQGKKTKIFSNGLDDHIIKKINEQNLCDAWSIDYKGLKDNVGNYIGVDGELYHQKVMNSINDIIQHNLPLEIRTTYFEGNEKDREEIRKDIKGIEDYMKSNGFTKYYRYFEQEDFRKKVQ